ncbi:DUF6444 domain-containing protein [Corynebacterium variabile]|uniref:DUF6444 domain-containing protein n=1 Tax=Corynebacterium variabile TaxID=1727 RepID=UPI003FD5EC80
MAALEAANQRLREDNTELRRRVGMNSRNSSTPPSKDRLAHKTQPRNRTAHRATSRTKSRHGRGARARDVNKAASPATPAPTWPRSTIPIVSSSTDPPIAGPATHPWRKLALPVSECVDCPAESSRVDQ